MLSFIYLFEQAPIQEFCIKHEITMYSDEGIIKPIFTFEEASVPGI